MTPHPSPHDRTISTHPTHPHPSLYTTPHPPPTHATRGNGHTIHTPRTHVGQGIPWTPGGGGGSASVKLIHKPASPRREAATVAHQQVYPRVLSAQDPPKRLVTPCLHISRPKYRGFLRKPRTSAFFSQHHYPVPRLSVMKKKKRVRTANRNERSRGRSLLRGQDMGKTQDHRSTTEQRLAVGGGWRRLAVPRAILNKKKRVLQYSPAGSFSSSLVPLVRLPGTCLASPGRKGAGHSGAPHR